MTTPAPGLVARVVGRPRLARVVDPRRVVFCRLVRNLMADLDVDLVDLAPLTRGGVSDEYVRNLLDERRADIEVQLRDVAAWEVKLGEAVLVAFMTAYLPRYQVQERVVDDVAPLDALGETGGALAAVGELAQAVTSAVAPDGPGGSSITRQEQDRIAACSERAAKSALRVGAVAAKVVRR